MGKTRKKMKIFRKENEIDSNESLRNSRKYYSHQVKFLQFFNKVGCVITMVIWSEFHMVKYRDDNNQENAPHFSICGSSSTSGAN